MRGLVCSENHFSDTATQHDHEIFHQRMTSSPLLRCARGSSSPRLSLSSLGDESPNRADCEACEGPFTGQAPAFEEEDVREGSIDTNATRSTDEDDEAMRADPRENEAVRDDPESISTSHGASAVPLLLSANWWEKPDVTEEFGCAVAELVARDTALALLSVNRRASFHKRCVQLHMVYESKIYLEAYSSWAEFCNALQKIAWGCGQRNLFHLRRMGAVYLALWRAGFPYEKMPTQRSSTLYLWGMRESPSRLKLFWERALQMLGDPSAITGSALAVAFPVHAEVNVSRLTWKQPCKRPRREASMRRQEGTGLLTAENSIGGESVTAASSVHSANAPTECSGSLVLDSATAESLISPGSHPSSSVPVQVEQVAPESDERRHRKRRRLCLQWEQHLQGVQMNTKEEAVAHARALFENIQRAKLHLLKVCRVGLMYHQHPDKLRKSVRQKKIQQMPVTAAIATARLKYIERLLIRNDGLFDIK